jgi:hypothetical protein
LALPRWAIGALALPVAMKVAKFVMSRATEEVSSPNAWHTLTASACSIPARASVGMACMASQNRRWSNADVPILVNRSAAVVFHQSANPLLEHGSTTRFSTARARYVPGDSGNPGTAGTCWSISAATPRSASRPHTAATAP